MIGINFDEANSLMLRPDSMKPDECYDLPVFKGLTETQNPVIISCWELSDEELAQLVKTKKVWLWILGETMPPVVLDSKHPWSRDGSDSM